MRSRTAAALLASLGITGGAAALTVAPALAATSSPAVVDTTPDDTIDEAAATEEESTAATDPAADDSATDESAGAVETWLVDALQPLVDDGTITQEQADAVATAIAEARPVRAGVARVLVSLDVLTSTLGVTAEELQAAFQEGQSIADVAAAQGVDVQVVIDAFVAAGTERIDAAVADGTLTAEEGDTRTAELVERVTELVNRPGGPGFGRGHGGDAGGNGPGAGPMGPGHDGNGPDGPGNGPAAPPAVDDTTGATDDPPTTEAPATDDPATTDTTAASDA